MIVCYLVEKKSKYFVYHREEGRYLSQCPCKYFFYIMRYNYSWYDEGRLAGQGITLLLWHLKVHISALKNLPLIRSRTKWTQLKPAYPHYVGNILLLLLHKGLGFTLRYYHRFSSISEVILGYFKSLAKVTTVISYYFPFRKSHLSPLSFVSKHPQTMRVPMNMYFKIVSRPCKAKSELFLLSIPLTRS